VKEKVTLMAGNPMSNDNIHGKIDDTNLSSYRPQSFTQWLSKNSIGL